MNQLREALYHNGQPSYLEAPDVVKKAQDCRQRLNSVVKYIVTDLKTDKDSYQEAKAAVREASSQMLKQVPNRNNAKPPKYLDYAPSFNSARERRKGELGQYLTKLSGNINLIRSKL